MDIEILALFLAVGHLDDTDDSLEHFAVLLAVVLDREVVFDVGVDEEAVFHELGGFYLAEPAGAPDIHFRIDDLDLHRVECHLEKLSLLVELVDLLAHESLSHELFAGF